MLWSFNLFSSLDKLSCHMCTTVSEISCAVGWLSVNLQIGSKHRHLYTYWNDASVRVLVVEKKWELVVWSFPIRKKQN